MPKNQLHGYEDSLTRSSGSPPAYTHSLSLPLVHAQLSGPPWQIKGRPVKFTRELDFMIPFSVSEGDLLSGRKGGLIPLLENAFRRELGPIFEISIYKDEYVLTHSSR